MPREWAEGFARLNPNEPPADVPPQRWVHFIDDCGRFLDGGWARQAAAFGWGPLDLFGCDRERAFARVDHAGLLWLLNGRKLVALTADTATIETLTGAHQTYPRRSIADGEVTLPWELGPLDSGRAMTDTEYEKMTPEQLHSLDAPWDDARVYARKLEELLLECGYREGSCNGDWSEGAIKWQSLHDLAEQGVRMISGCSTIGLRAMVCLTDEPMSRSYTMPTIYAAGRQLHLAAARTDIL